jgi:hypothetical protein
MILGERVVAVTSDDYAPQSRLTSEPIAPLALVLTRTIAGGNGSATRALACTAGGRVYGVLSSAATYYDLYRPASSYTTQVYSLPTGPQWLFWHDPRAPDAAVTPVAPALTPDPTRGTGGTALTVLADGRLVAGTTDGRTLVYDPATGATRDLGIAIAGAWQIAALAAGYDGLVYYEQHQRQHLAAHVARVDAPVVLQPRAHGVARRAEKLLPPRDLAFDRLGHCREFLRPAQSVRVAPCVRHAPQQRQVALRVDDRQAQISGGQRRTTWASSAYTAVVLPKPLVPAIRSARSRSGAARSSVTTPLRETPRLTWYG